MDVVVQCEDPIGFLFCPPGFRHGVGLAFADLAEAERGAGGVPGRVREIEHHPGKRRAAFVADEVTFGLNGAGAVEILEVAGDPELQETAGPDFHARRRSVDVTPIHWLHADAQRGGGGINRCSSSAPGIGCARGKALESYPRKARDLHFGFRTQRRHIGVRQHQTRLSTGQRHGTFGGLFAGDIRNDHPVGPLSQRSRRVECEGLVHTRNRFAVFP